MRLRALAALAAVCAFPLLGQEPEPPKLKLSRITSAITIDGDLSDPGWREATEVPLLYEINPGDNTTPAVKTLARIGYDAKYFYVSFWCEDPDIGQIRAPFVDRDGINDDQDYVGILLDVENRHHSAIEAIYVFNSRMLFRVIGQYIETTRDPSLWIVPVARKDAEFSGSALFSYKLNWQTVLYLGYGDNRALFEEDAFALKPQNRQFLLKISYAFQR